MKRKLLSSFDMEPQGTANLNSVKLAPPSPITETEDNALDDLEADLFKPLSHHLAPPPVFQNLPVDESFCPSGFDMLGILMRVATRPKPKINIGSVDMSCALIVCDITQHDHPIVYCSEAFENLTRYSQEEIVGKNCRFLQSPDGIVSAGQRRKYVDEKAVLGLREKISSFKEIQLQLVNYRKGGQAFLNLITLIPIAWDSPQIRYYVGFQAEAKSSSL